MAIRLSAVKYEVSTISSNVNTQSSNVYALNLSVNSLSSTLASISSNVYAITNSSTLSLSGDLYVGGNIRSSGAYHCTLALSTTSTLNGSDLTVEFNTTSDPNGWYSSGTKRVTPTVAGWYNVYYQVKFNQGTVAAGQQWNIQLLRNNVTVAITQTPVLGDVGQTLVTQVLQYFNGSTDYLTAQVYASSTTTLVTTTGWSRLELFRIA